MRSLVCLLFFAATAQAQMQAPPVLPEQAPPVNRDFEFKAAKWHKFISDCTAEAARTDKPLVVWVTRHPKKGDGPLNTVSINAPNILYGRTDEVVIIYMPDGKGWVQEGMVYPSMSASEVQDILDQRKVVSRPADPFSEQFRRRR